MTNEIITINTSEIRVIFPQNFQVNNLAGTEASIPSNDIMRPGDTLDTVADDRMLELAANYFDISSEVMSGMQVSRPQEGRILISAKFSYGI